MLTWRILFLLWLHRLNCCWLMRPILFFLYRRILIRNLHRSQCHSVMKKSFNFSPASNIRQSDMLMSDVFWSDSMVKWCITYSSPYYKDSAVEIIFEYQRHVAAKYEIPTCYSLVKLLNYHCSFGAHGESMERTEGVVD